MDDKQKVTIKYKEENPIKKVEDSYQKKHLRMVHPFLAREFRQITRAETRQKKVFKEFFGDEKFEPYKLRAIFKYQK